MEFVPVGDLGNAADPTTGYGAVSYGYSMGKYEVTLNQYTAFLNAVAKTDTYELYNPNIGADLRVAGISRSGSIGSYTYSVIGSGNHPVTYINWFDVARFANWMQNGQPTGSQNASTTERGAYTLDGAFSGVINKNPGATFYIPTENEWYKAAYYQPAVKSGDSDGYWLYPTASNEIPNSRNGSISDPNSGNFYRFDGTLDGVNDGYAVGATANPSQNYLTDVGAFNLADSYYGTFDQGGNVWEWNDAVIGTARGLRGGSFTTFENELRASARNSENPALDNNFFLDRMGFRLSFVPEPGVGCLLLLGIAVMARRRG